jgi:hypothetical protein
VNKSILQQVHTHGLRQRALLLFPQLQLAEVAEVAPRILVKALVVED